MRDDRRRPGGLWPRSTIGVHGHRMKQVDEAARARARRALGGSYRSVDDVVDVVGRVVLEPFAVGSISERRAILLRTPTRDFEIRRVDGPPVGDPALLRLVGKSIRGRGTSHGYTLVLSDYAVVTPTRDQDR